jgi:hypothetical protein
VAVVGAGCVASDRHANISAPTSHEARAAARLVVARRLVAVAVSRIVEALTEPAD